MKNIGCVIAFFLISCAGRHHSFANNGKVVIANHSGGANDSGVLIIKIYELSSNKPLPSADVWIDNDRFDTDTAGTFIKKLAQGRYKLIARSMGFANYDHKVLLKKGDTLKLFYYLDYFKGNQRPVKFH